MLYPTDTSMILIIVLVVAAGLGFMLVGAYNRLVGLRQNANQAFADIDVQLKQRQDLIPIWSRR
jgi:LemA protein